jgi:hypothetical protein
LQQKGQIPIGTIADDAAFRRGSTRKGDARRVCFQFAALGAAGSSRFAVQLVHEGQVLSQSQPRGLSPPWSSQAAQYGELHRRPKRRTLR